MSPVKGIMKSPTADRHRLKTVQQQQQQNQRAKSIISSTQDFKKMKKIDLIKPYADETKE